MAGTALAAVAPGNSLLDAPFLVQKERTQASKSSPFCGDHLGFTIRETRAYIKRLQPTRGSGWSLVRTLGGQELETQKTGKFLSESQRSDLEFSSFPLPSEVAFRFPLSLLTLNRQTRHLLLFSWVHSDCVSSPPASPNSDISVSVYDFLIGVLRSYLDRNGRIMICTLSLLWPGRSLVRKKEILRVSGDFLGWQDGAETYRHVGAGSWARPRRRAGVGVGADGE